MKLKTYEVCMLVDGIPCVTFRFHTQSDDHTQQELEKFAYETWRNEIDFDIDYIKLLEDGE